MLSDKFLSPLLVIAVLAIAPSCYSQTSSVSNPLTTAAQTSSYGSIAVTAEMTTRRAVHTATRMNSGKVLLTGGLISNSGGLQSAEIYDAEKNTFTSAENMLVPRASHTATLLPNGKVLIAGGYSNTYLNSSELYDETTGKFTPAGDLTVRRSGHTATKLKNGKILLTGGTGEGWSFLNSAEIYDPETNRFTAVGNMNESREAHTATLMLDGRVLITGGHKGRRADIVIFSSAEIFDPATGRFEKIADMKIERHKHESVMLANGSILILGGADGRDQDIYSSAELFDPAKGTFTKLENEMLEERFKMAGTAVVLENGKVLIAGGSNRAEIFDPINSTFHPVEGKMGNDRFFSTATLLKNGGVLITGGYEVNMESSSNAWIYKG